jgi:Type IV secretion-system coupling protein DNA-binding domain
VSLLGRDATTNKDIDIEQGNRTRGLYIIGATGSGKSVLTEQLAVQDAKDGLGFCVLDPHGDLINNIMVRIPPEREKDVILLDPTDTNWPFGLNLFSCTNPQDPLSIELAVNQITHVFEKIFGMSKETPRLSQFVRQIAYTIVGTDYTMCEIPYLLLDKPFRDRVVPTYGTTGLFWKSFDNLRGNEQLERSESTLDRIDSLISNHIIRCIVGQNTTTIDFRGIMDSGKILLVSLHAQLDAMTDLLGSIIIGQILLAALSRADTTKRRQFNLYVDEFQKFATPDMSTLLVEARKYAIGTTIAHQSRFQSGLTDNIRSTTLQAASLVCFRITAEDTEFLAPSFDTTPPQAEKPPGTTPADILNNLVDHPDTQVKDFWAKWAMNIIAARLLDSRLDPPNLTPDQIQSGIPQEIVNPWHDFGGGYLCEVRPREMSDFIENLRKLFYNTSINQSIDIPLLEIVLRQMFEILYQPDNYYTRFALEQKMSVIKKAYEDFRLSLLAALRAVRDKPIEVNTTEWQYNSTTQQTHADRKAQIANELTHLPVGNAKVRVPKWDKDARKMIMVEHTIRTIPPDTDRKLLAQTPQIRMKYLEQTRAQYCRPRSEVEEEIRKRTQPPPPPTTRTHPV